MNVTTTGARQGQFEIRFWHKYVHATVAMYASVTDRIFCRIFEEELARVKGGFGPCNT